MTHALHGVLKHKFFFAAKPDEAKMSCLVMSGFTGPCMAPITVVNRSSSYKPHAQLTKHPQHTNAVTWYALVGDAASLTEHVPPDEGGDSRATLPDRRLAAAQWPVAAALKR